MPRKNLGPHLGTNDAGMLEIRWTDKGRSKRASTGTANLAEAQEALAEFILGARREEVGDNPVCDIIDAYLAGHVANKVISPGRIKSGIGPIREFFGKRDVTGITPDDCSEYEKKRRAGKVKGFPRPVSGGTIRLEMSLLTAAINDAVKNKRLAKKMTPDLTRPPKPPARSDWVTPEVYKTQIIPELPTHTIARLPGRRSKRKRLTRLYRFMMIAFNTAQRRRAIETLTWAQVDLSQRMIDFNPVGRIQTKKRRPVVPINDKLLAILTEASKERLPGSEYVLDFSGPIGPAFDKWRTAAGLPWLTRHTIRRTWATWAAIRGVSMTDIAAILGDNVRTVEESYLKFAPGYLRGAVENSVPLSEEEHLAAGRNNGINGALRPEQGVIGTTNGGQGSIINGDYWPKPLS